MKRIYCYVLGYWGCAEEPIRMAMYMLITTLMGDEPELQIVTKVVMKWIKQDKESRTKAEERVA